MTDKLNYGFHVDTVEADATPTPDIWRGVPAGLAEERSDIYYCDQTFENGLGSPSVYADADCGLVPRNGGNGCTLNLDGTDNDEVWAQWPGTIYPDDSAEINWAFECSFKSTTVTDDEMQWFLGLMLAGRVAADGMVDDTGVMCDTDYIGFHTLPAAGEALGMVYDVTGGTEQVKMATAITTMVVSTWYKVGFRCTYGVHGGVAAKRVKIYINGTVQTTYITDTNIQAATFPEEVYLAPTIGVKNTGGTAESLDVRWLRAAAWPTVT